MTKPFSIISGPKPKGRPRGKPFQKGEHLPYQFKPGQSGNPGGKPKVHQTLQKAYESFLGRPAPVGLCRKFGLPEKSTYASVIAADLCPACRGLNRRREGNLSSQATTGSLSNRRTLCSSGGLKEFDTQSFPPNPKNYADRHAEIGLNLIEKIRSNVVSRNS